MKTVTLRLVTLDNSASGLADALYEFATSKPDVYIVNVEDDIEPSEDDAWAVANALVTTTLEPTGEAADLLSKYFQELPDEDACA